MTSAAYPNALRMPHGAAHAIKGGYPPSLQQ